MNELDVLTRLEGKGPEGATLGELYLLAEDLRHRRHKLAIQLLPHNHRPYGVWRSPDGQDSALFNYQHQGLWRCRWQGAVKEISVVNPPQRLEYAREQLLFDDSRPRWQQYEAMQVLRNVLDGWGLIKQRKVNQHHRTMRSQFSRPYIP